MRVTAPDPTASGRTPPTRRRHSATPGIAQVLQPLAWTGVTVLAGAALFVAYLYQARTQAVDSDGAAQALQAWDILHGNVLLHGWILGDASFYTTELPYWALIEAFDGLRPDAVHLGAAVTYTLIVVLTAAVARGRSRGREGIFRALIGAGLVAAPAGGVTSYALLSAPDHTGTTVPILVTLLIFDRLRPSRYLPIIALALLTWMLVADQLTLVAAAAPLAVTAAVRAAGSGRGCGSRWHYAWLGIAAAASVGLAHLAVSGIHAADGFSQISLSQTRLQGGLFASPGEIPRNARMLGSSISTLFSLHAVPGAGWFSFVVVTIRVMLACGCALAMLRGLARFRTLDMGTQILVVAVAMLLLVGVLGTWQINSQGAREIAVLLPLSAALAGRTVPARLLAVRGWLGTLRNAGLAATLCAQLAGLGFTASSPAVAPSADDLAGWLVEHGLTSGVAGYWESNIVTLDSGGRIRMAAVLGVPSGLTPYWWETNATRYDPASNQAYFVVTAPDLDVPESSLITWFGQPARIYYVPPYTISVWNKNLLPFLR
jgi:hypothetical protein